jgi:hypothetical protein
MSRTQLERELYRGAAICLPACARRAFYGGRRAPTLPPDLRDPASNGACVPRPIDHNLPALFARN